MPRKVRRRRGNRVDGAAPGPDFSALPTNARIPFYRTPILRAVALGYASRVLDRPSPAAVSTHDGAGLRQLLEALRACPQPELVQRDWAVLVEAEPGLAAL